MCLRERVREAEYSHNLFWGAGVGKQNPDSRVVAPGQAQSHCSMARTSRYCVTRRNTAASGASGVTLLVTAGSFSTASFLKAHPAYHSHFFFFLSKSIEQMLDTSTTTKRAVGKITNASHEKWPANEITKSP